MSGLESVAPSDAEVVSEILALPVGPWQAFDGFDNVADYVARMHEGRVHNAAARAPRPPSKPTKTKRLKP